MATTLPPKQAQGLVRHRRFARLGRLFVCLKYGIELDNPVNGEGRYRSDVPRVAGLTVWEANPVITEWLQENGHLLANTKIEHSYAHCWRHKTPLIYRATGQWFIGMDKAGHDGKTLRNKAMKAVERHEFFPPGGARGWKP